jgi:4-hydroxybenzoate polyprenyltransferase
LLLEKLSAWVYLIRPTHWVKNFFVLAGIFFSGEWRQIEVFFQAFGAFITFCLASSAIYCLNDALDVEQDRNHPRKQKRPLASGRLSLSTAYISSVFLTALALGLAFFIKNSLGYLVVAYITLTFFYSVSWKHLVLVDVFCIAAGFIFRLLAGTLGIDIEPSEWFLLCTFSLSLFFGFSKRFAELVDNQRLLSEKRLVLQYYSPEILRLLMGITLSATLITYGLYTTSARTQAVHPASHLIYTVPLVMFGLFRYLFLVLQKGYGENTVLDILKDKQMLLIAFLYPIATGFLLYGE